MGLFSFKKKAVAAEGPATAAVGAGGGDVGKIVPPGGGDGSGGSGKKGKGDANVPDPRKARKFFEYAQVVADSRNYDYAIVCWVNGLMHDPENMTAHEKLHDVARRRMVHGGKAAGSKQKKSAPSGKGPGGKMLYSEFFWAHDPLNAKLAADVMEQAAKGSMYEVAYWIAEFALQNNDQQPKPDKAIYAKIKSVCSEMKAWDRAVEAQRRLLALDPNNMAMLQELKQLEAEMTVSKGGYGETGGNFRSAIKDVEKQKALEEGDAIAATDSQVEHNIERARAEYAEAPDSVDLLNKLVRALLTKGAPESEREAIDQLTKSFEKSGTYLLKMQIGDIRMKQYAKKLKELRTAYEGAHVEATKKKLHDQYQALVQEKLKFELAEFTERCKNYPTKMDLRFHLGVRLFASGEIDQAIANFQEAKSDAKFRAQAMRYLGEAFLRKHWFDEAMDTFRQALESHPTKDDKLGLDLRYFLMMALEAKARREQSLAIALEAQKVASGIAQIDFNFRDIRHHMDNLRKMVDEMRKGKE